MKTIIFALLGYNTYQNLQTFLLKHALNLPENLTVKEAHQICDAIENDIKANLKNTEVTIHVENF